MDVLGVKKVVIVGGCGHVGIPLGLALASRDFDVTLLDIDESKVKLLNSRQLPFVEEGAEELLERHVGENLRATIDPEIISLSDVVIFVTGTPVDEHHNPKIKDVMDVIMSFISFLREEQLIILRSTLFPGTTELLDHTLRKSFPSVKIAFCPERIVQGKGIDEIYNLPQIISATSKEALEEAEDIFQRITCKTIVLSTGEAELAKLMTNAWRYLEFAIANQFYMITNSNGYDFYRIYNAMRDEYPRAQHFPKPGFTAGPCLFKDTMQLASFHNNNFYLGQSAMLVNEGFPNFIVESLLERLGNKHLTGCKVAILGMAFKADNDDIRESLSFKLKKLLEFKRADVICHDPYVYPDIPLEPILEEADAIIIGTPHKQYLELKLKQPFIDCWGIIKSDNL